MVSKLAKDDVETLKDQGLNVQFEDIIRLNALGLKVEHNSFSAEWFALPRVAFLGNNIFREPTIEHDLWLDRIKQFIDEDDDDTLFAIKVYLSLTKSEDLCDPCDYSAAKNSVWKVLKSLKGYTKSQILNALEYVIDGNSDLTYEFPAMDIDEEKLAEFDKVESLAIGHIKDGIANNLGLSISDLKSLTSSQLYAIKLSNLSKQYDVTNVKKQQHTAEYYRTLDEITNRLKREKNQDGGQ